MKSILLATVLVCSSSAVRLQGDVYPPSSNDYKPSYTPSYYKPPKYTPSYFKEAEYTPSTYKPSEYTPSYFKQAEYTPSYYVEPEYTASVYIDAPKIDEPANSLY